MTTANEKIEPILFMLAGLIVFFACLLIFVEHFFASDGQVFQVISNILSGIAGAFIMRIKPANQGQQLDPANTLIVSQPSAQSASSAVPGAEKQA